MLCGWLMLAASLAPMPGHSQSGPVARTLAEAYDLLGFDPSAPGNQVVVLASDIHFNLNAGESPYGVVTTNLDPRMIRVINAMDPPPARMLISGDVTSSMSAIPGGDATGDVPTYRNATNEMALFYKSLRALTNIALTNIQWIPGNHDQGAFETNAAAFSLMFPSMPTHQHFEWAGMHWFLLNPGNYGDPDEQQKEWARTEVAKLNGDEDIVVMTHQPPFPNPVAHRGMGLLLRELFGDWKKNWWMIDSHDHARTFRVWRVGNSKVAEVNLGPGTTNTFVGFTHDVGFAFLCLSNGVVGQIYYHYDSNEYVVWPKPDWDNPLTYSALFEGYPGLLWRRFKTAYGGTPEQMQADALDAIQWWSYPKALEWEMPLGRYDGEATHFVIGAAGLTSLAKFSCSPDRVTWTELETPAPRNLIYAFSIPEEMRGLPKAYLRMLAQDPSGNNWIGAWGLATTNGPGGFRYPRFEAVPDYTGYPGRGIVMPLSVTSPYSPPDALRYELVSGPPGSAVDRARGFFTWMPGPGAQATNYLVTVRVSDLGTPPANSTISFTVRLLASGGPVITSARSTNGAVNLEMAADPGRVNVYWTTDRETWSLVAATNTPTLRIRYVDAPSNSAAKRFYKAEQIDEPASATGPSPWPISPPWLVSVDPGSTRVRLLTSTNLVDWEELTTQSLPVQVISVADPTASAWSPRAYKAERER